MPPAHGPDPSSHPPVLPAPWRGAYVEGVETTPRAAGDNASFLLSYWEHPEDDAVNFVVARTKDGIILLNRYPYVGGHLLVALGEARPALLDYSEAQRAALWRLTDQAVLLMQEALRPQGINIGVNQGRAAGAGVPQHLHVHVVPRWSGDVNFMEVVGRVRVMSFSLEQMFERCSAAWRKISQV